MRDNDVFVTGTDTSVGKTVLSALLCAALGRAYWKPIQTGTREGSDREAVMRYAELPEADAPREAYRFEPPVSPHLAASMAGVRIDLNSINQPSLDKGLVIEGAGGALVPINERELMIDLMRRLDAPVVIAARTSLGTINHTLLTVRALRSAQLYVQGVVLIGEQNDENRKAIEHYGDVEVIGWIPPLATINRRVLLDVYEKNFSRGAAAVL